jgi:hypothetical protein
MEALQQANNVRLARADLKRAVKAGEVKVAEVLLGEIPDWLRGMTVEALCLSIRRFPRRQYQRFILRNGITPTAVVGNLTRRQRIALGNELADWETSRTERRRQRAQLRREGEAV